jgi:hypothetical protein
MLLVNKEKSNHNFWLPGKLHFYEFEFVEKIQLRFRKNNTVQLYYISLKLRITIKI